jgi:hypothetical protein
MGVGCQRLYSGALPPRKRVGTHWIGGWVGPTAGVEDLALTSVRTPNHPASNESLYKLPTLTRPNKIKNNLYVEEEEEDTCDSL